MAHLRWLELHQFRNHAQLKLTFDQPVVLVVGDNGQGKTSILEAIMMLATGLSFRADAVAEMIRFNQELASVIGGTSEDDTLEVMITRGVVQGKRTQSRLFSVNQVRRRRKDVLGKLGAVIFRPEDMRLMEGSPGRRRSFLDTVLSQSHALYATALSTYEQALIRRNKLLPAVREREMPASVLTYWTLQLIKHGTVLQTQRQAFLATFAEVDFPVAFKVEYQPSLMSAERMAEYQTKEIAAGHTLIGPHKDDFDVHFQWRPGEDWHSVSTYGSRGQQRMAVLWLKVAELEYLRSQKSAAPMLLLDDIFSELDHDVRHLVLELVQRQPTLITTTETTAQADIQRVVNHLQVVTLE